METDLLDPAHRFPEDALIWSDHDPIPMFHSPEGRPPWSVLIGAILLCGVTVLLGAQGAVAVELMKTKEWQAISEVEFRDPLLLPETVAVTLQSPSIWHPVAQFEGIPDEEFQKHYETGVAGGTQIIQVSFVDEDPDRARRITDAIVTNYVDRFTTTGGGQQQEAIEDYIVSLREFEESIERSLEDADRLSTAVQIDLQSQLVGTRGQINTMTLRLAQQETEQLELRRTDPRIVSPGFVLEEPVTPAPLKAAVFGAAAGGLIGLLFTYLAFHRSALPAAGAGSGPARPPEHGGLGGLLRRRPNRARGGADGLNPATTSASSVPTAPIGSRPSLFAKRAIDIVVSAVLLVILSPMLIAIGLAVRLTSAGPALFRQERIGKGGVPFEILKFRTMHVDNDDSEHRAHIERQMRSDEPDPEAHGTYKLHDPRVTAVGRHLRRLSLDELPQLWNVLVGKMSLVGPRPALAWEYELFSEPDRDRLRTQPGCSGLWQVSGRSLLATRNMLDLDLHYVRNWSLARDLVILFKTPLAMVRGDGAQ